MIGVEGDGAASGLSSGEALIGRLDAMVDGVADEVRERFAESVENALVEIGVFAGNFQRDVLAAQLGDVANNARKAAEELLDGNHADFQNAFVQFIENARLKAESFGELGRARDRARGAVEFGERAMQHGFADDQFTDKIHDGVDARGIHAQSAFGNGGDSGSTRVVRLGGFRWSRRARQRWRRLGRLGFEDVAEQFMLGVSALMARSTRRSETIEGMRQRC